MRPPATHPSPPSGRSLTRLSRPQLLLALAGTFSSTAFALGCAWTLAGSRIAGAERRLDEIDTAHVAETRWQAQQTAAALAQMQSDARGASADISQINARLGVIESKLDTLVATLKRQP